MKRFRSGKEITDNQQVVAASMASSLQAALIANPMASITDPYGSYTGVPLIGDQPIQDADDL